MIQKPTYEELQQRVDDLEKEAVRRIQEEKKLRDSEEKYRIISELATELIYQHDFEGNVVLLSPAWETITGYSVEQGLSMNIRDILTADSYELAAREIGERLEKYSQGKELDYIPITLQLEYLHKDGTAFWVETTAKFTQDKDGNPVGVIGIARDITDRRQAEKALLESETRFRETAEMLPSVLIEFDLNGILTYVNSHGFKLAGYVPEDFENGFHVLQLVAQEDHEKHYQRIEKLMQGEKIPPTEYRLLRKDGSTVWGLVTSGLIHKDGRVVGVRTFTIDISKRKQAETLLLESEKKYRSIFESISDVFYRTDLDGKLTMTSPSGARLLGYDSIDEMIGKNVAKDFYANPQDREHLQKEIMKHGKIRFKGSLKRKDGTAVVVETLSHLIYDETGNPAGVEGIFRDITEQVRIDKALKESEAKARVLLDAPTDSLLLVDTEGILLDLNETAAQRLGKSMEELIGTNIYDIFSPAVVRRRKSKTKKALETGKPVSFQDERDGLILDNTIYPIFDTQGKVVQLAVYAKDITMLKKTIGLLEEREKELELKASTLIEINTAMEVLLQKREKDKTDIEDNVLTNVKELIEPYFEKIKKTRLNAQQETFLNIIESNIGEIISPFVRKISLKYLKLTPKEIKIVNLIKHGHTTKKIAQIMNISPRTVDTHRKNIRKKIGLEKMSENLRSHLLSIH